MADTTSVTLSHRLSSLSDIDFASDSFRHLIEDHLSNITMSSNSQWLDINPTDAHHYKNNFYGLLYMMQIEPKYHWIFMRVNGIKNSLMFDGVMNKLLHPDLNMVDSLYGTWRTRYRTL